MRIAYLDEAGISNPAQEPYLVVAGVIVDGDRDTGRIAQVLESLAKEYELGWIGSFHAKEIWHGSGQFDRRDPKWPLSRRRELLQKLVSIPKNLELPVAVGFVHRPSFKNESDAYYAKLERILGRKSERASLQHSAHLEAFVKAAKAIDSWMQKNAFNERVMLIAENTDSVKQSIKLVQAISQSRDVEIELVSTESFKTEHIIETVHFAEKRESPFLQLADTCAYVVKRKLMRKSDVNDLYDAIEPQLIRLRRDVEPFRISF